MLECLRPSVTAILSREPTRSQLVLLMCSLALHISLIKMSMVIFQPGLTQVPLGTDARYLVRCHKGLHLYGAVSDKVRDELCFILERCRSGTTAERPSSHSRWHAFADAKVPFSSRLQIQFYLIWMLPAPSPSSTSRL